MRLLAAAIMALVVAVTPPTQPGRRVKAKSPDTKPPTKLTLLYTCSARGQIRSCNCTKFRFGGYGRELTLLKSIREKTPDVVLVEGGDSVEWTGFQGDLKLEVTKKALAMLEYNAMVPGEDELGRSGHRLIDRFDPKQVPIVCANLLAEAGGKLSYVPYIVAKTKGGLRVGIIGLIDQQVGRGFQEKYLAGCITDPVAALKPEIDKLRKLCDVAVVVYHGPEKAAEKLACVKGVDLILATHRTTRDVAFPAKDKNVAEASTRIVNGVVIVDAETRNCWSLGRIDLDLAKGGRIASAKHSVVYLDRSYDEDPKMVEVYESYNTRVKEEVLSASAKLKKDMENVIAKRGLNLAELRARLHKSPFATDQKCKTCHSAIHESWSKSRHANAVQTLKKMNQEFDPECVGCHVTGLMVRQGFKNMKETPELGGVQCESCHGPGLAHSQKPEKGYGPVTEQTCRSCHTDERTPEFDFDSSWAKVKH